MLDINEISQLTEYASMCGYNKSDIDKLFIIYDAVTYRISSKRFYDKLYHKFRNDINALCEELDSKPIEYVFDVFDESDTYAYENALATCSG